MERLNKGQSIIDLPDDFTVIDLETTGLSPASDEIIEFAGIKVRNGIEVDRLQTFVRPVSPPNEFIQVLTGISPGMLADAPLPTEMLPAICDFIGDDVVIGHNVGFDVNFLYDSYESILHKKFTNNYINTLRLSHKLLSIQNYTLSDVSEALNVAQRGGHRAMADAECALLCYNALSRIAMQRYGSAEEFAKLYKSARTSRINLRTITADADDIDTSSPLYGMRFVFTGKLELYTRAEAAQLVVNLGGICDNDITHDTNILVVGKSGYMARREKKSRKIEQAEAYILKGQNLIIVPEDEFLELIKNA